MVVGVHAVGSELTGEQQDALFRLRSAGVNFEPLDHVPGVDRERADELVERGLAERGLCARRAMPRGYDDGYRLTKLGWDVLASLVELPAGDRPQPAHGTPSSSSTAYISPSRRDALS